MHTIGISALGGKYVKRVIHTEKSKLTFIRTPSGIIFP